MFPIQGIRPATQENSDILARKPGQQQVLSRKPLVDRSINQRTPKQDIPKGKTNIPILCKDDDLRVDGSSYKEIFEDTYEDICPKSQRFNKTDIIKMLRSYTNTRVVKTPPPVQFDIDPMFIALPERNSPEIVRFDDFFEIGNESFEHDVPFPSFDLNDFSL